MTFLDEQAMAAAEQAATRLDDLEQGGGAEGPQGPPGVDGKDAYEIARDLGYGGTRTQWLASLIGPQGDRGLQGLTGQNGSQGPPGPVNSRAMIVNTGSLSANAVKQITVTFPTPMPSGTYSVTVTPMSASPHTVACGVVSTAAGSCVIAVRSTAAVNQQGLNLHLIALAP